MLCKVWDVITYPFANFGINFNLNKDKQSHASKVWNYLSITKF